MAYGETPFTRIKNVHWPTSGITIQWTYPLTITSGSSTPAIPCSPIDFVASDLSVSSCQVFFGLNAPSITPPVLPPGYALAGTPSVSPMSFAWADFTMSTPSFGGELLEPTQNPNPEFSEYGPAQSYISFGTSFDVKLFGSTLNGDGIACYLQAPPSDPVGKKAVGYFVSQGQVGTFTIDVSGVGVTLNGNPLTFHHAEVNASRRTALIVAASFTP